LGCSGFAADGHIRFATAQNIIVWNFCPPVLFKTCYSLASSREVLSSLHLHLQADDTVDPQLTLGLALGHDASLAVARDGHISFVLELERLFNVRLALVQMPSHIMATRRQRGKHTSGRRNPVFAWAGIWTSVEVEDTVRIVRREVTVKRLPKKVFALFSTHQ
jgi:hypothetical protein